MSGEKRIDYGFQPAGASALLADIMLCWPCMGLSGVEGAETMPELLLGAAVGVAGPESSSSPAPPSSRFLCE